MGRAPCCDKANVKKGPWSPEEDAKLKDHIEKHGTGGNWIALPQKAGLKRCGKSCRLRWLNYLRPNIKHGEFSEDEDRIIYTLFATIGSRWSIIAAQLSGRTDNDIKNYWNTKLKKILMGSSAISNSSNNIKKRSLPHDHQSNSTYTTYSLIPSSHTNISLPQNLLTSTHQYPSPHSQTTLSSPYYEYCGNNNNIITKQRSSYHDQHQPVLANSNYSNTLLALQAQDGDQHYMLHREVKNNRLDNRVIFGNEAASSSSDGSCVTNQIINNDPSNLGFQSNYFSNNYVSDHHNQGYISSTAQGNAGTACLSTDDHINAPLDYSTIDEINQLISTGSGSSNFFVDDMFTTEDVRLGQ